MSCGFSWGFLREKISCISLRLFDLSHGCSFCWVWTLGICKLTGRRSSVHSSSSEGTKPNMKWQILYIVAAKKEKAIVYDAQVMKTRLRNFPSILRKWGTMGRCWEYKVGKWRGIWGWGNKGYNFNEDLHVPWMKWGEVQ